MHKKIIALAQEEVKILNQSMNKLKELLLHGERHSGEVDLEGKNITDADLLSLMPALIKLQPKKLFLANNSLKTLPVEIRKLPLEVLDLRHNKLQGEIKHTPFMTTRNIPQHLFHIPTLKELSLNGNPGILLKPEDLTALPAITSISIDKSQIATDTSSEPWFALPQETATNFVDISVPERSEEITVFVD